MTSTSFEDCDAIVDHDARKASGISSFNVTVPTRLHVAYTTVEIVCAVLALTGNVLVLIVFARCRALRTVTNYYVISLAVADTLVAMVGIPSAISTSVGLPRQFHLCLVMNSILMLLCTGSILSLVAVTVDRFLAIVHPLSYAGDMTKRRAKLVICGCWILASVIGLLPAAGWHRCRPSTPRCFFIEVMDFRYLVFVYFATIVCPVLFIAFVYALIFRAVRNQVKSMSLNVMPPSNSRVSLQVQMTHHHGSPSSAPVQHHPRMKTSSSEERAAKSIAVIIALFVISWLPLYTLNTILFFHPNLEIPEFVFHGFIILSHCNSAWNPVVYAWGTRDFRAALRRLLFGRQGTYTGSDFHCSLPAGHEHGSMTGSEKGLRKFRTKQDVLQSERM